MIKTIGRIDKADFSELHLEDIDIKVDTGAYTSSIHSHDIKKVVLDGETNIEFKLLDPSYPKYNDIVFKSKNFKEKEIKSSFGTIENRYIINTTIVIFDSEYNIELSLSERSDMKYPVLLGRKFLNKKFIVNTSLKNISFKLKQEKNNN